MAEIVFPAGAFGANEYDSELDSWLRMLATRASYDSEDEWSEKYGTTYENDVFMMHKFCWCDRDDCAWCTSDETGWCAPNFWYKPTDFKVWWYKYIGRGVETQNKPDNLSDVFLECLLSLEENNV